MKLMIPIFHTEFDAQKLLVRSLGEIPPSGDFGGFFVATFCGYLLKDG